MPYLKHLRVLLLCAAALLFTRSFCLGQTLSDAETDSLHHLIKTTTGDSIRGRALNKLAFHYLFVDVEKAVNLLEQGLQEAEEHQLHFGKAELLNTKATYFDISGNKDSAEILFNESLAISRAHGYKKTEVLTVNGLGLFHWKTGNFDRALAHFFQALEINEAHFPEDQGSRANYLSNIGLIYQSLKQHNKAIDYHSRALEIRENLQLPNGQAISYANLGVCHQNLEQYNDSEAYFIKAIKKAEEAQNGWMYYSLYGDLGNIYNLTDRNEAAIIAYKKSLDKPESVGSNPKGELSAYSNIASIYNKINQPKTAVEYAKKGLNLLGNHPQLYAFSGGLHYTYAESNYMIGNIDAGSKSMLVYRNVLDSTFSEQNANAMAEMEEKYESARKDKALLEQRQVIQQKELDIRKRTLWLISSLALLLLIAGILFYLFKRKEALAKQTALELKLAEEKERTQLQKERLRISRELHDNIGSYLTLINASVEQLPEMSSAQITENYPDLKEALALSMRELRKTVWLLNNQEISIDALALRLRDFFKPINQNGTKIIVKHQGNTDKTLTDIQATHLFRIVQEAVSNACKYSEAKHIHINVDVRENINFSVVDDGLGFETSIAQTGNGLRNMQSRMTELMGEIHIKSKPGEGTAIEGYF